MKFFEGLITKKMLRHFYLIGLNLILSFLLWCFQNCTPVQFVDATPEKIAPTPETQPETQPDIDAAPNLGVFNGHFDIDVSSKLYNFNQGLTDAHVHEYDKRYKVTTIDFFSFLDSELLTIDQAIPQSTEFYLIVGNAEFSPGIEVVINGKKSRVTDYAQRTITVFESGRLNDLLAFTLTPNNLKNVTLLQSLSLNFKKDLLRNKSLVISETKCVVENRPSLDGHYRNGALTIQAIATSGFDLLAPSYTAAPSAVLLWETTVFWHLKGSGCN